MWFKKNNNKDMQVSELNNELENNKEKLNNKSIDNILCSGN